MAELGILKVQDGHAIRAYAECQLRYEETRQEIIKAKAENNGVHYRAMTSRLVSWDKQCRQWQSELGLTPLSRVRFASVIHAEKFDDPRDDFLAH